MKILILIALFSQLLLAAPAFQGKRTFTQPNGDTVTYRLQGDEYLHWMERDDGEIMLYSKKNKRMESATIKNGQLKASGHAVSTLQRSMSKDANIPKVSREELLQLQQEKRIKRHSKHKDDHSHR